jgi:hypothetical protein
MSTDPSARPLTARTFLFGEGSQSDVPSVPVVGKGGVLPSLTAALGPLKAAARHAIDREIASSVARLLDFDLIDLLAAGWRKHAALLAAAKRTIADPAIEEVVELATHRITSTQRPTVDVFVDDVRVGTVHLELSFEGVLKSVVATVRGGRLVNLHHGICEATATLAAEGVELTRREGHLDVGLMTGLGEGIPLISDADAVTRVPTVVLPEA